MNEIRFMRGTTPWIGVALELTRAECEQIQAWYLTIEQDDTQIEFTGTAADLVEEDGVMCIRCVATQEQTLGFEAGPAKAQVRLRLKKTAEWPITAPADASWWFEVQIGDVLKEGVI